MKQAIRRIVDAADPKEYTGHIFGIDEKRCESRDLYFLTSGDKIRFFLEPDALDKDGNVMFPKERSINKVGEYHHYHIKCVCSSRSH